MIGSQKMLTVLDLGQPVTSEVRSILKAKFTWLLVAEILKNALMLTKIPA